MSAVPSGADPIILKILNGVQSGVEVSLADATYTLGSGNDDDIQLIDVTLKPGHARLRIGAGKAEIAAAAGGLQTSIGGPLPPNSEWRTLEPLEIVTAGTTRLALGPRTANWATVGEDVEREASRRREAKPDANADRSSRRVRVVAMPLLALVLLAAFAAWFLLSGTMHLALVGRSQGTDIEIVRNALNQFPFGRPVGVRQEVDGAIYATGYVQTPVERRALSGAVDKTAVPVRLRLYVLESMRNEIKELIATEKLDVSYELNDQGVVVLNGLILNQATADAFADRLKDQVLGISSVVSHIRTGPSLLGDVQQLAETSQLKPWLLFRLDKEVIEVSGALPAYKVDAWVGFLQGYQNRYASDIGLRSFVQLQGPDGKLTPAPTSAITLGKAGRAGSDIALDLAKLKSGDLKAQDVLVGQASQTSATPSASAPAPAATPSGATAAAGAEASPAPSAAALAAVQPAPSGQPDAPRAATLAKAPSATAVTAGKKPDDSVDVSAQNLEAQAAAELNDRARAVLEALRKGQLGNDVSDLPIFKAILAMQSESGDPADKTAVPSWYLPLLKPKAADGGGPCWPGSDLMPADLLPALFWLDLLSASDSLSLATFSRSQQLLLMEVALDPHSVMTCSRRTPASTTAAGSSLYLREIARNPGFIRYIVRGLPAYALEVSGASVSANRYVLTKTGDKLYEGAAPDYGSRIALVGELGLAIQAGNGLSTVIFGPDIQWQISDNLSGSR